jgi:hypothetical protein
VKSRGRRTQRRQAEHRELGIEEARRRRQEARPELSLADIPLVRVRRRKR